VLSTDCNVFGIIRVSQFFFSVIFKKPSLFTYEDIREEVSEILTFEKIPSLGMPYMMV